ncbi:hypothetical protein, partial [Nocardia cyriacigeorgica]|uniref:hypothetical protein n=1 Tax=Nocardia cyriacigeorgica TaxID=135487 RepID=UPI002455BDBA
PNAANQRAGGPDRVVGRGDGGIRGGRQGHPPKIGGDLQTLRPSGHRTPPDLSGFEQTGRPNK